MVGFVGWRHSPKIVTQAAMAFRPTDCRPLARIRTRKPVIRGRGNAIVIHRFAVVKNDEGRCEQFFFFVCVKKYRLVVSNKRTELLVQKCKTKWYEVVFFGECQLRFVK